MNFDYMFDPPNIYEFDATEIKEKMDCEYCGKWAVYRVSIESRNGWSDPIYLCEGCKDKEMEGLCEINPKT